MNFTPTEINTILSAGSLAPSGGNTQPWRVIVEKDCLQIYLDHDRVDSFLDIDRYASIFALGPFTENIVQALDYIGIDYKIIIHDHVLTTRAVVEIYKVGKKKTRSNLFQAIAARHTNRQLSDGRHIDLQLLTKMADESCIDYKKFHFTFISDSNQKNQISQILGEADAIRYTTADLLQEVLKEFRWSKDEANKTNDGIELTTLELPANMDKIFRLIKKFPTLTQIIPAAAFKNMARPMLLNSSHLACLYITQNAVTHPQQLAAGRILENFWLQATQHQIAIQPWSIMPFFLIRLHQYQGTGFTNSQQQILKDAGSRLTRQFNLPPGATPLFIFRLSYAPPATYTSMHRKWPDFTLIK